MLANREYSITLVPLTKCLLDFSIGFWIVTENKLCGWILPLCQDTTQETTPRAPPQIPEMKRSELLQGRSYAKPRTWESPS